MPRWKRPNVPTTGIRHADPDGQLTISLADLPPRREPIRATLVAMRWVGEGAELFSARVDLIAPDDTSHWVSPVADALKRHLPHTNGSDLALCGVDQGRGHEGTPVVGLTFLLRASDVGTAEQLAVDTAVAVGADAGVDGRVYDVVLVPEDTFVLPESERSIPMPD